MLKFKYSLKQTNCFQGGVVEFFISQFKYYIPIILYSCLSSHMLWCMTGLHMQCQ